MSITRRVQFPGHDGNLLDARLELPESTASGYAIFAHCFSCGKDNLAATRIARALTDHGIAVLRFDFTGLGKSEGDFANTNFSTNVEDVVAATHWMNNTHGPVGLLVGHSLGGAAVIVAARKLPEVRAVATIGAPADADHVLRQIASDLGEIEEKGEAKVTLGTGEFTIRQQFLNDVAGASVRDAAAELDQALMILHAPLDNVVGIDNATALFTAAKHPKSFVSLDQADHMLSDPEDAEAAADIIAAWAKRYMPGPEQSTAASSFPEGTARVSETGEGGYANMAIIGEHRFPVDEPVKLGGLNTGPTPVELLSAALAACTNITLRMYLNRKEWSVDRIATNVRYLRYSEKDDTGWNPVIFKRELEVTGALSDEQRSRLIEIANKCPVHDILEHASTVQTKLKPPTA